MSLRFCDMRSLSLKAATPAVAIADQSQLISHYAVGFRSSCADFTASTASRMAVATTSPDVRNLNRHARAPLFKENLRCKGSEVQVNTMTATSGLSGRGTRDSSTWKPDISGKSNSVTTQSNRISLQSNRAASPEEVATTEYSSEVDLTRAAIRSRYSVLGSIRRTLMRWRSRSVSVHG